MPKTSLFLLPINTVFAPNTNVFATNITGFFQNTTIFQKKNTAVFVTIDLFIKKILFGNVNLELSVLMYLAVSLLTLG